MKEKSIIEVGESRPGWRRWRPTPEGIRRLLQQLPRRRWRRFGPAAQ